MRKSKFYKYTFFKQEIIKEVLRDLEQYIKDNPTFQLSNKNYQITMNDEEWQLESEDDFFDDYHKGVLSASLNMNYYGSAHPGMSSSSTISLSITFQNNITNISITAPNREFINKIFSKLERNLIEYKYSEEIYSPKIFIGHGGSHQWRDLKDHLQDKHGYKVEAYEIGARAGLNISDILKSMLQNSSIAFLILTGEDVTAMGDIQARQNVVHELGLFQGKLGMNKAIILLENGTEEFSNISGIQQIRFNKGSINETFGEVIATINRELKKGLEVESGDPRADFYSNQYGRGSGMY